MIRGSAAHLCRWVENSGGFLCVELQVSLPVGIHVRGFYVPLFRVIHVDRLLDAFFVSTWGGPVAWFWLAGAIAMEVISTLTLKTSGGFGRSWSTAFIVLGYTGSFAMLGLTLRSFDVGMVYAIWSAVGTAVIVTVGIAAFGEPATATRVGGVALVVIGVVVLNLSESTEEHATEHSTAPPLIMPTCTGTSSGPPLIPRQVRRSPQVPCAPLDRGPDRRVAVVPAQRSVAGLRTI
jgi:small multidrug resistance pump